MNDIPGKKATPTEETSGMGDTRYLWEEADDLPGMQRRLPVLTSRRPDFVIWSKDKKKVDLVELILLLEDILHPLRDAKSAGYLVNKD